MPIVSARSVKIGPSELLAGSSAPVVGSVFVITPEAGDASGITDSAVAMLPSRLPANPRVPLVPVCAAKLPGLKVLPALVLQDAEDAVSVHGVPL